MTTWCHVEPGLPQERFGQGGAMVSAEQIPDTCACCNRIFGTPEVVRGDAKVS